MYQIIKDGSVIAYTENPNYIKKHDNGCFVLADENTATGIAYEGTPYHLFGRPNIENVESVMLLKVDIGKDILNNKNAQASTDNLIIDQEYRLALLEMGVN